jgi:cobalt-zinc-cadmium efflux system membrane fusion protein
MQIKLSQEQVDNLGVKVGPLLASQQVPLLYAPARVVVPANHEMLVSTRQSGFLVQLHANIGDRVEKGQVIAQLNSPELVALQQQFLTASSDANLSALEYARDKNLQQEGVIADRRWQETRAMHSSKSAKADEAKQLLQMAGMSPAEITTLAKTRKLSSQLNVHAPISGSVLERSATVGARLDMQAPLYRIADLSELWLEINVPQERLQEIRIGDKVQIEDSQLSGTISLLGQSVNASNQTVLARAIINHPDGHLRVGQNINVQIMQESQRAGFSVPNAAIAQNAGHSYVFVRNTAGFAVTEVEILGKHEQDSFISAAMKGTEQIAVHGSVALKANWLGLGGGE